MSTLVTTDWLADHLEDENLVILHSSYFLGVPGHSPRDSYLNEHIPGSRLFDIDTVCDHGCPLPHMLPTAEEFSKAASALGISNDSHVVVYDDGGVRPSFRVWWTFKAFGHENVSVLDGGLMKWSLEGRPITQDVPEITPGNYQAADAARVTDKANVIANVETRECEVLDARGPGRFLGADADPRPGVKSGHIPGAKNLFFGSLFNKDGTLKSKDELQALVDKSGLDTNKPVITSCGSGVTACILFHVLDSLGLQNLMVYDGSWAEWGTAPDTPVEQG